MWSGSESRSWAIETYIFITAAHIPDILNAEADQESRKAELKTKWKQHESLFGFIQKYPDFLPFRWFACIQNECPTRFFAYRPYQKNWSDKCISCFMTYFASPFSCIGKVLQKIISDKSYWYINCPKMVQPVLVYLFTIPIIYRSIYHST